MSVFCSVGSAVTRGDAVDKALGLTRYAADFTMPGMLYGKVLFSSEASARIRAVDTSKARALPGVRAVMTAEDIPGVNLYHAMFKAHRQVLVTERVRCLMDAVALVAADTPEIAREAVASISVDYEPMPAVFDPLEAMEPGCVLLEEEGNVAAHWSLAKGDVEAAFKEADVVVANRYRTPFNDHVFLEPEAAVGWIDELGVVNLLSGTQSIENFRSIASLLGIPHSRVRVRSAMVGGAFGGKEEPHVESYVALLVSKTGRPVKICFDREESFLIHAKKHPFVMDYRTGATRDGKLLAVEAKMVADAGAYVYLSPVVTLFAFATAPGPYRVPNVKVDCSGVLTNNPITSTMRGLGATAATFAYESQMDEAARAIDMDPVRFRRLNLLKQGDTLAYGQKLENAVALEETLDRAVEALGEPGPPSGPRKMVGQGVSCNISGYGMPRGVPNSAAAYVGLEKDGSVLVRTGISDLGAGENSTWAQIAAEVLGVDLERVSVHTADSAMTPLAGLTVASRATFMAGNAVHEAASEVRRRLVDQASEMLEIAQWDLELTDNRIVPKGSPGKGLSLTEVAEACGAAGVTLNHTAVFNPPGLPLVSPETGQYTGWHDYTFGTHAAEVEVDMDTGEVRVLKLVACHDVGRAINPASVKGQFIGGASWGCGYALTEDLVVREGRILTDAMDTYIIPTALDLPDVDAVIVESGAGKGPFGAKGIGEPPGNPPAPAILTALRDATGARITTVPATPERVSDAVRKVASGIVI